MQKLRIAAALSVFLAGCTTTGNGTMYTSGPTISPVLFDKPYGSSTPDNTKVIYTDQNEKPLDQNDIKAINAAIATQNQRDYAPQEEVMQGLMSDEL